MDEKKIEELTRRLDSLNKMRAAMADLQRTYVGKVPPKRLTIRQRWRKQFGYPDDKAGEP